MRTFLRRGKERELKKKWGEGHDFRGKKEWSGNGRDCQWGSCCGNEREKKA